MERNTHRLEAKPGLPFEPEQPILPDHEGDAHFDLDRDERYQAELRRNREKLDNPKDEQPVPELPPDLQAAQTPNSGLSFSESPEGKALKARLDAEKKKGQASKPH